MDENDEEIDSDIEEDGSGKEDSGKAEKSKKYVQRVRKMRVVFKIVPKRVLRGSKTRK